MQVNKYVVYWNIVCNDEKLNGFIEMKHLEKPIALLVWHKQVIYHVVDSNKYMFDLEISLAIFRSPILC